MRKNRLFCLFIFLAFTIGVSAQLAEKVREFLGDDTLKTHSTIVKSDSDSANIANMKRELEAARLSEANMRMEMEQLKLQAYAADSVKLAQQRLRIDSLRKFTQGVPVVVEGDTLFYIYAKRGGHTPQQRAVMNATAITELGKRFNLQPDSLYLESSDIVTDLMYGDKVLASFTDQDGLWEGRTRDQLAADKRQIVVDKLKDMKKEHSLWQLGKRILFFILVLVGQYLLFWATTWLFKKLKIRIQRLKDTKLKPISIQDYELLDTQKQVNLLVFLANMLRYVIFYFPANREVGLSDILIYLESGEKYIWWSGGLYSELIHYLRDMSCCEIPGKACSLSGYRSTVRQVETEWFLSGLGDAYFPYYTFSAICFHDCDDLPIFAGFRFGSLSGYFSLCGIDCFIGLKYGDREHYCRVGYYLHASV